MEHKVCEISLMEHIYYFFGLKNNFPRFFSYFILLYFFLSCSSYSFNGYQLKPKYLIDKNKLFDSEIFVPFISFNQLSFYIKGKKVRYDFLYILNWQDHYGSSMSNINGQNLVNTNLDYNWTSYRTNQIIGVRARLSRPLLRL